MGLLPGHDLKQADLGELAHLVTHLFIDPCTSAATHFPELIRTRCGDQKIEGVHAIFVHEPAHDLFGCDVDRIGFHHQFLLI